jgi:ubiquinone/menaquinone biosynthesis C-methylase UbiE
VKYAVEPSRNMALIAKSRGILVSQALGAALPYKSATFDCVLLVTVLCFVDDARALLRDCWRVLSPTGHLLIAEIDNNSPLGKIYQDRKATDVFYSLASFHSIDHTISELTEARFRLLGCTQTLFGIPPTSPNWDNLKTGFGEGAFVVIIARKLDA